jgi:hypothetical protein
LSFDRFKDEIRREKERKQKQRFADKRDHAAVIASAGHCAAQAPQSTHLSASIV